MVSCDWTLRLMSLCSKYGYGATNLVLIIPPLFLPKSQEWSFQISRLVFFLKGMAFSVVSQSFLSSTRLVPSKISLVPNPHMRTRINEENWEELVAVAEKEQMEKEMHFILVHGACHGAWCWYKVVPLLEQAGHKVTALDLGASGIHPKQATELRAISDYHEPLMEFMASLSGEGKKVILVGHSMGGVAISAAMERFPEKVAVGIFASAVMPAPLPGTGYTGSKEEFFKKMDFLDTKFSFDDGPENPPTSMFFGPSSMSTKLYQLCPAEDLTLGMLLIRPCRLFKESDVDAELGLTRKKYGSVARVYIVCEEDEIIKPEVQRWMIERNPTEDVKSMTGADHMLMFSKTNEFCSFLLEMATKYS